jgi:hypothetical protein
MTEIIEHEDKVKFDPGFSQFPIGFPRDSQEMLEAVKNLKQPYQRKFEFQKLEMQSVQIIKHCSALYLGCLLWGSYLYYSNKDKPKEIYGNIVMEMDEEKRNKLDYGEEIDFILNFIEKLDKSSIYYFKRPANIELKLLDYLKTYKEFAELNDQFRNIKTTDEIKPPKIMSHFENFSQTQFENLRDIIFKIIESKNVKDLLNLGYYEIENH